MRRRAQDGIIRFCTVALISRWRFRPAVEGVGGLCRKWGRKGKRTAARCRRQRSRVGRGRLVWPRRTRVRTEARWPESPQARRLLQLSRVAAAARLPGVMQSYPPIAAIVAAALRRGGGCSASGAFGRRLRAICSIERPPGLPGRARIGSRRRCLSQCPR